jgi:hypothetical protein
MRARHSSEKIEKWRAQPIVSLQLVTNVMVLAVASMHCPAGVPLRGFRNDEQPSSSVGGQELQRLFAGRKAPEFAVVGIVLCRLRRPEHHELAAFFLDQGGQFFTFVQCHVARTAMRAFVVAHAGPFIGPPAFAVITFVEIEKPCHGIPLGSQAIIAARYEIDKSAVTQVLKLLPYLGFDVLVASIKIAKMPFESIELF